jgi:hypothetical protein
MAISVTLVHRNKPVRQETGKDKSDRGFCRSLIDTLISQHYNLFANKKIQPAAGSRKISYLMAKKTGEKIGK